MGGPWPDRERAQGIAAKGKGARKLAHEFSRVVEAHSLGAPRQLPPEEVPSLKNLKLASGSQL